MSEPKNSSGNRLRRNGTKQPVQMPEPTAGSVQKDSLLEQKGTCFVESMSAGASPEGVSGENSAAIQPEASSEPKAIGEATPRGRSRTKRSGPRNSRTQNSNSHQVGSSEEAEAEKASSAETCSALSAEGAEPAGGQSPPTLGPKAPKGEPRLEVAEVSATRDASGQADSSASKGEGKGASAEIGNKKSSPLPNSSPSSYLPPSGGSTQGWAKSEDFNPYEEEEEPLSIAEELMEKGYLDEETEQRLEELRQSGDSLLAQLQKMSMAELIEEARKENLSDYMGMKRQDLIFMILKERLKNSGLIYGEGTLEILPDGFGFLRSPEYHYLACPDDIYVSPSQIRRFGLRTGVTVSGQIRPPKENERYFALLRVEAINYQDPNLLAKKPLFEDLTPLHPYRRLVLETTPEEINTRVVDLIVPVGFGQRGLIVSPPRAGKTILMQKMAKAALTNYPDLYVFMLLIDERPEEVTDMERQVKGKNCEVISSTFDEPPSRHVQVAEMVLEKAKRMVEYGHDVLIFLDSITRLARAWNHECTPSGKILSGGLDANALQRPKRFFGSARQVEEGGSLTIIATALIDTGSKMDEVIFEEFKGTGNLEIVLDRRLVDRRVWPAIDINRSGTRKEEMLMDPEEYRRVCVLRRILNEMNPIDAMELLITRLQKTRSNAEFLMSLNVK